MAVPDIWCDKHTKVMFGGHIPAANGVGPGDSSFGRRPEIIVCVIEGRKEAGFRDYIETFWSK